MSDLDDYRRVLVRRLRDLGWDGSPGDLRGGNVHEVRQSYQRAWLAIRRISIVQGRDLLETARDHLTADLTDNHGYTGPALPGASLDELWGTYLEILVLLNT